MLVLPMFHAAAGLTSHTTVLRAGQPAYVMRRFDLEKFLANVEKFSINDLTLVPPITISIIMSDLNKKYSLASLRSVIIGAAPLGKASQVRLRALLATGTRVIQGWDMTEVTSVGSMMHYPGDDELRSVGHMLPGMDAK